MSGWLRQAGGFWINPEDPQRPIPVDSHAPYAWEALVASVMTPDEETQLLNQYIGDLEQKEQTVVEPEHGEAKVDYKGIGGAEAKAQAEQMVEQEKQRRVQEQFGANSGLSAANTLTEMGWVRISTDDPSTMIVIAKDEQSVLAAEDAILAEAMNSGSGHELLALYLGHEPQITIMITPENLKGGLAAAIAGARSRTRAPSTGGLGPWRIAGTDRAVSFSAVQHRPSNPPGKQWCVVSPGGKELAAGASRKWAERSARKIDWQKRHTA